MFYKGSSTNYIENFNINYERIRSVILFLCFITISIVYYSVDIIDETDLRDLDEVLVIEVIEQYIKENDLPEREYL